jgi:RNA polymerase sigma-70 factor (ECF subfamily)
MEVTNRPIESDTDQDLLIKVAGHDRAAFAQLYRLHYDHIFRYCARRLFNRHAAEDVTSTVFFKVMRTIGSFEGNSKDFRNWLYRIATNAVNDHLRTAKRRADAISNIATVPGRDHTVEAESDVEFQEQVLPVKQALLTLKPKQQTVITLRFFEKLKLTEIAEILGQDPATTRSQLSRALSSLRKKLGASVGHGQEVRR